jgi:PBSX family phage terminase large subunit
MPFSEKQQEFFENANHRWNVKVGATRSGKTYMDYFVIPKRIRVRIGKPGLVVIIGVSKETIRRNIIEPLRQIWGEKLVGDINSQNICYLFGEKVYCLGAEKISQVSKIRGSSIKYCYGDEVADWNEEVFTMLKSRLDKPYSCFDGACNPQHPTHWFKSFLDSDADIYLQHYTIFDNPFLDPKFVEELCKEYFGTIYYDRYIKGLWKRAEGAIYRKFADNPKNYYCKIVDKIDSNIGVKQILKSSIEEITIGVDFGGNKSGHAFVATAKTRGYKELIILRAERHFGEYDSNDIDRLLIEFMEKIYAEYHQIDYVYWDNAEQVLGRGIKKAIEEKFSGVIVRPALKTTINDRIQCTLRLMGIGRLFFTDDCQTIVDALSDAVWNDKKLEDERLDDGSTDIDSLDGFEYTFERDIKRLIAA